MRNQPISLYDWRFLAPIGLPLDIQYLRRLKFPFFSFSSVLFANVHKLIPQQKKKKNAA